MNVVNPGVLAELDVSTGLSVVLVLMSLLGAAITLLLACVVVARAGIEPASSRTPVPVTVGRALPGVVLPPRELSRAVGASRAPPGPPSFLRASPRG